MSRLPHQRSRRTRQRGVALMMVLSALTILAVMLTEFQQETSAELGSAMSDRDAVQAEYSARSAIALTRLLIASEPTIRKGMGFLLAVMRMTETQIPVWQHADKMLGLFNDEATAQAIGALIGGNFATVKGLGLTGSRFEVKIVDEDSKLNFNYAARGTVPARLVVANQFLSLVGGTQYDKLFDGRDADGNFHDRQTICSAVIDWTDPDTEQESCIIDESAPTHGGAEDSYYEGLRRPFARKNAAFDSLEELHRVRGVNDDFWATFIDPDTEDPARRVVTVWGSDKINVNTANGVTIMATVCPHLTEPSPACQDPVMRSKVIGLIEMMRGMMPGVPLFKSAKHFVKFLRPETGEGGDQMDITSQMLGSLGVPPIKVNEALLKNRIKVKSDVFSIYATGVVTSGKRETRARIHAVVDFRGAPPPGQARQLADLAQAAGIEMPATESEADAGLPPLMAGVDSSQVTTESILGALEASSGGHIIYYRIN